MCPARLHPVLLASCMGRIDPMYQFSLDAYIDLFNLSIEKSPRSHKLEERISHLNDYHTYALYRWGRSLVALALTLNLYSSNPFPSLTSS